MEHDNNNKNKQTGICDIMIREIISLLEKDGGLRRTIYYFDDTHTLLA
jgi:hypothetical protein